jgi:hypothetical protein
MEWTDRRRVFESSIPSINRVVVRLRSDGVAFVITNCKNDGCADRLWEEILLWKVTVHPVGEEGFDAEFKNLMNHFHGMEVEEEKDGTA